MKEARCHCCARNWIRLGCALSSDCSLLDWRAYVGTGIMWTTFDVTGSEKILHTPH